MAARPSWQGHLKLSLVACPVSLYTALNAAGDVRFHMINPKTMNRIRMVTTDAETGDPLERSELVRGYEFEKGKYVILDDEEIQSVKLESTKTIEIEEFVPESDIDRLYWERPYFMVPDGKMAVEAFTVIREAMEKSGRIALGRVVLATRERLMALEPRGKGILATTLRSHDEVRNPDVLFDDIPAAKPDKEMISIAERIIDQKAAEFDPRDFNDRYEDALRDLIDRKLKGKKIVAAAEPEDTKVVDLMDALRASLGRQGRAPASAKRTAAERPRRAAASRTPAAPRRTERKKSKR